MKAVSDALAAQVQQLDRSFRGFSPEEQKKPAKTSASSLPSPPATPGARPKRFSPRGSCRSVEKIAFQLSAGAALVDPALQEKIGLSAEQRRRLNAVYEQAGEKMQQLQRDTAAQVMQLLDEEQTAELKKQTQPAAETA